jgi:hypothetical protein
MAMASLDSSAFTTVFDNNFAAGQSLDSGTFPLAWGNSNDFSLSNGALTLTSRASEGWANTGFLQADTGASAGNGYGLYSVTCSLNSGEGPGVAATLWPSNNAWPGPELDVLESLDSTRNTGYSTIHYADGNGNNQYDARTFNVDLTQTHTYSMDWEPGQITYYVDGEEIYNTTSHVPKDAADGGTNASFGAQIAGAGDNPVRSSVSVHLSDISYAAPNGGSNSTPAPAQNQTASTDTPAATTTTTDTTPAPAPDTTTAAPDTTATAAAPDTTTPAPAPAPDPTASAAAPDTAAITQATTSDGSAPQFAALGDPNAANSQTMFTSWGANILQSGQGSDVMFVDGSQNGWATIENFHAGDVTAILGFQPGVSTITWSQGTDPAGNSGATAAISLNGDGNVNTSLTFAGVDVSQAQAFGGSSATMDGTPFITLQS